MKHNEMADDIGFSISTAAIGNLEKFWGKYPEAKKLYDDDLRPGVFISMRGEKILKKTGPGYATTDFGELPTIHRNKEKDFCHDPLYFVLRGLERIYHAPDIVQDAFHRAGPSTVKLFLTDGISSDFVNDKRTDLGIKGDIRSKLSYAMHNLEEYDIETNSNIAAHIVGHAGKYFEDGIADAIQRHFLGRTYGMVRLKSMLNQFKSMLNQFKP